MLGFIRNISDKISNRMLAPGAQETDGYYDEYYDDDYEEGDDEYYEEPEQTRSSRLEKPSRSSGRFASSTASRTSRGAKDNVYSISPSLVTVHKQAETVIQHPKNMQDAVEVGNHVRSGRMNIVDLTGVPTDEAQRIADYLCGISDALDGAITRVNNTIITVSPPTHRVMQDYRDDSTFDTGLFKKAANSR
jgi:cell division inhibitor SepF